MLPIETERSAHRWCHRGRRSGELQFRQLTRGDPGALVAAPDLRRAVDAAIANPAEHLFECCRAVFLPVATEDFVARFHSSRRE